ncbi:serine hydrolase domain-containing protein [Luteimonas sp. R10]|uniref:serine hydrolase domain-containing protein n=1 Tax=Luteimonas sp. R10 TaxID=3108176 RepID=UPI0030853515|nr:serine hydrolase domain-containing protein [Luteimonas sp. R10]
MIMRIGKEARALSWTALLLALACLQPAFPHDLEHRLGELMAEHGTVGLAVVVVKDNAVVYQNSLGWKDRERRLPLQDGDVFRIASISKSFAATSILQLVENGRLSLDDDVSELVGFPVRNPRFPERAITLEMLLNHTSSITDGPWYGSLDVVNPEANEDWRDSYADRAPGERYEYSNLGYNMVGTIVERASGQRFDAYVRTHVLEPLGLYGGYLADALDADRFAQIYRYREGEGFVRSDQAYARLGERLDDYRMGYSTPVFSPTGGLKISAPDLAAYMLMHMNRGEWGGVRILAPEHADLMQTPAVDVDGTSGYGLAIRTERALVPGVALTGHTGSAYGLYSSMYFDAEKQYGFVVITNGTRDMAVRDEVNRLLYAHFVSGAGSRESTDE